MKKGRGKEVFLIVSLFLILVYALVYYSFPGFQEEIEGFNLELKNFAEANGYLGALFVSFIGSASIFIIIPYPAFVFLLATTGLNIWLLSLLAGLGAGLGEITSYFVGYAGGRLTDKHYAMRFSRVKRWISSHPRLTPFVIYFFGLTPLPDDFIFIPLGLVRYSFKKAFIPGFLGKVTMLLIVTYLGKVSLDFLGLASPGFFSQVVILLLTVLIVYAVLKIDWKKIIQEKNV